MGITLDFNEAGRVYRGHLGELWPVPSLASIGLTTMPCQVVLRLSTENGDLVVEEITYRRRSGDPPITPATIAAAPSPKMVELAMLVVARGAHYGAKMMLLGELGIEWVPDMTAADMDALIADAYQRQAPESAGVAVARRRVEAQDPALLRRHIRSRRVRRRKVNERFLAKVAKVYTDALAKGDHPTRAVALQLGHWNPKLNQPPKTAQRWVGMARRKGILSETTPRRKGGVMLRQSPTE